MKYLGLYLVIISFLLTNHIEAQEVTSDLIPKKIWYEVPVMRLNFYMMGKDAVDESITLKIGKNIDYLNKEFEGKVKFVLNELIMESQHAYLPDLHIDFFRRRGYRLNQLIHPIEKKGSINIYLFETYKPDGQDAALMGFTPILRMRQSTYDENSPRFDRIFIAYPGLEDMSTIVHEMGHFLGLQHPWEMNHIDQDLMGLNSDEIVRLNHMSYGMSVSDFTDEQLERMRDFALRFRTYLIENVEQEYN